MTRTGESYVGPARRLVRIGSIGVLTASTAWLIATLRWHDDRAQRFVVVSAILLGVLALHLVAALRLTSRRARVAPVTLVAGLASAVAATALWILAHLSAPGFPVNGNTALLTVELGAVVAAALAGFRTRELVQAAFAGLWAAALGSYLVFVGSLLAFTYVASSVPNTHGLTMPPSATAAQRLSENRIEAPDGYLGLLLATLTLVAIVCVTVPMARRAAPARPAAWSQLNVRET